MERCNSAQLQVRNEKTQFKFKLSLPFEALAQLKQLGINLQCLHSTLNGKSTQRYTISIAVDGDQSSKHPLINSLRKYLCFES